MPLLQIQFRRDTLAHWESVNPILLEGEMALVTDAYPPYFKLGDGVNPFTDLPILSGPGSEGNGESGVPVGTVIAYPSDKIPHGYYECDGRAVSRRGYTDLFSVIGTTYGEGDGKTTFNLPDFRKMFLRGLSEGRELGEVQGDAIRNITASWKYIHSRMAEDIPATAGAATFETAAQQAAFEAETSGFHGQPGFDASQVVPTAEENRPVNMPVVYCIKAFGSTITDGQLDLDELVKKVDNTTNHIGTVIAYTSTKLPEHYMLCDGTELERAEYPDLFEIIGTTYGAGDGKKTFNLPDLRGMFVRGLDLGRGLDPKRKLGEAQEDAIRNITGAADLRVANPECEVSGAFVQSEALWNIGMPNLEDEQNFAVTGLDVSQVVPTAEENRPVNLALVYAIKVSGRLYEVNSDAETLGGWTREEIIREVLARADKVPVGSVQSFAAEQLPEGYLLCDGQAVSRLQYDKLFAAIGTTYGEGDGTYTFNLPDYRRMFLRGLSEDRALGEVQGDAIRNIATVSNSGIGVRKQGSDSSITSNYGFVGNERPAINDGPFYSTNDYTWNGIASTERYSDISQTSGFKFDASRVVPTAEENRPVNMAVVYAIKAYSVGSTPQGEQLLTIVYPEAEETEPFVLTPGVRLEFPNPFPGQEIACKAEIQLEGKWYETGWSNYALRGQSMELGSYGVRASYQADDDQVVLVAGETLLLAAGSAGAALEGREIISAPVRVKVWVVGKALVYHEVKDAETLNGKTAEEIIAEASANGGGGGSGSGLKVGAIILYPVEQIPAGFMLCEGQELKRANYEALFEVIGTKYGEGDGVTTFNLPDLRGQFIRAWDNGKGLDPERELGSEQGDAIRNIQGSSGQLAYVDEVGNEGVLSCTRSELVSNVLLAEEENGSPVYTLELDASEAVPTAEENRPANIALAYMMKVIGSLEETDGDAETLNGKTAEEIIAEAVASTDGNPVGAITTFASEQLPEGYLLCDGREVGRTQYEALFAAIGEVYGAGDGTTTFQLPDLRGLFLRGLDTGRGLDPDRELGEQQGDAIRNITGTFGVTTFDGSVTGSFSKESSNTHQLVPGNDGASIIYSFDPSKVVPIAEENRPVNMAVVYAIKAYHASHTLQGENLFAVVYPEGTEQRPYAISLQEQLLAANPFPGQEIACRTEIKVGGSWQQAGWISYAEFDQEQCISTHGVQTTVLEDGSIQLKAGIASLVAEELLEQAPIRVKVWVVGRVLIDSNAQTLNGKTAQDILREAQDYTDDKLDNLDLSGIGDLGRDLFAVIYPEGTEDTPHVLACQQKVVFDNPFPEREIACQAEIQLDGMWQQAGWSGYTEFEEEASLSTHGVRTTVFADGTVQVTAGIASLALDEPVMHAPVRVKVWVVGKAVVVKETTASAFKVLYPNGGQEESPAEVVPASVYKLPNPFPGQEISCRAEILVDGQWGETGYVFDGTNRKGCGVAAYHLAPEDLIVVQTGEDLLASRASHSGNPFGFEGSTPSAAPCRVKVWKVGQALASECEGLDAETLGGKTAEEIIAEASAQADGNPVGAITAFASEQLPEGYLLCDGREVGRAQYQALFANIGEVYGAGDGETTFQLPDLRGLFLRGLDLERGLDLDRELGEQQGDAIRNFTGWFNGNINSGGVFQTKLGDYNGFSKAPENTYGVEFDPSRIVPTAEENRPVNLPVVYAIKAFSAKGTPQGENLFTVLYPQGTEDSPYVIGSEERLIVPNPFPGEEIACRAEIFYEGVWGESGWVFGPDGAYGVFAGPLSDEVIVVQSGSFSITGRSSNAGNPFGLGSLNITSAPVRVKVWVVGKVLINTDAETLGGQTAEEILAKANGYTDECLAGYTLGGVELQANKNQPGGYLGLDEEGKIPSEFLSGTGAETSFTAYGLPWISELIDLLPGGGPVLTQHGLPELDPEQCLADCRLICIAEDGGYAPGEQLTMVTAYNQDTADSNLLPVITDTEIYVIQGSNDGSNIVPLVGLSKDTGDRFDVRADRWKAVFRIWYPQEITISAGNALSTEAPQTVSVAKEWQSGPIIFNTSATLYSAAHGLELADKRFVAEAFLYNKSNSIQYGYEPGSYIGQVTSFDDNFVTTGFTPIVNGDVVEITIYKDRKHCIGIIDRLTGDAIELSQAELIDNFALIFKVTYFEDVEISSSNGNADTLNNLTAEQIMAQAEARVIARLFDEEERFVLPNGAKLWIS